MKKASEIWTRKLCGDGNLQKLKALDSRCQVHFADTFILGTEHSVWQLEATQKYLLRKKYQLRLFSLQIVKLWVEFSFVYNCQK